MSSIQRVLIANRGEIACRVIRTCRSLGVETVAVYSDADAEEPHVRAADMAVRLGPAPVAESYLRPELLIRAALATSCDAVHPGYGFLSENAAFAQAVRDSGLVFIGPSPESIALMGDKAVAKRHVAALGVPVVPGTQDERLNDDALIDAAEAVGFPLLIKAVAGGGGKGMRTVRGPSEMRDSLAAARREASAAFGDDGLILERLVSSPRHIEFQVFGDSHGNVVHLLERECSVQRRHQKVVEECPSPALTDGLRARMGAAAVAAARSVSYEGAGTVEFLVAGDTLGWAEPEFFFLEMNTRLQVEHPVTEEVTGLDLVELQFRIAAGERLPFSQGEVQATGHAIEVRVYAEDPWEMLPQAGSVLRLHVPTGPGIRADIGVAEGSEVGRFYDPMLGKLIVHADDRAAACDRLARLLRATTLHGVVTNIQLLTAIVEHPVFRAGDLTTGFIAEHLANRAVEKASVSAMVAAVLAVEPPLVDASLRGRRSGTWGAFGPWRSNGSGGWACRSGDGDDAASAQVWGSGAQRTVVIDGTAHMVEGLRPATPDGLLRFSCDGQRVEAGVSVVVEPSGALVVWVHTAGENRRIALDTAPRPSSTTSIHGATAFSSPMPGAVTVVNVEAGATVTAGTTLVVVEAMKMEHPIVALVNGVVSAVHVRVGDTVESGRVLVSFEPEDEDPHDGAPDGDL